MLCDDWLLKVVVIFFFCLVNFINVLGMNYYIQLPNFWFCVTCLGMALSLGEKAQKGRHMLSVVTYRSHCYHLLQCM